VADTPVQIFLSYARNDDVSPPEDLTKPGFVTALYDQLVYNFRNFGEPAVKVWRDVKRVEGGDQFDEKIMEAISNSAILVVVLSPNWMASEYCRKELNAFAERWRAVGGVKERIVVVGKRHVPEDRRPSMLQGQTGYRFYALDDPDDVERQREFFVHGKGEDPRYLPRVDELSGFLSRRSRNLGGKLSEPTRQPGKTVYLAKSAPDMDGAYARLVEELLQAGCRVLPEPNEDIPPRTAIDFVDKNLSQADLAIHLLGEEPGYTPQRTDPIVKLQLARAARRLAEAGAGSKAGPFQRIIWAPKVLDSQEGEQADRPRNPQNVLAKFDAYQESDTVEGDTLSKLVDLVLERVSRGSSARQPPAVVGEAKSSVRLYLNYEPEDAEYAFGIGRALKANDIAFRFPNQEGTDQEKLLWHRQQLRDCDSVLVCWASASDRWAKAAANELVDWRSLGRSRGFDVRAVVAGPPPGIPKKMFEFMAKDDIDIVLDLTGRPEPLPEDLRPIIRTQ